MSRRTEIVLSEIEVQAGVTVDQVREIANRAYVTADGVVAVDQVSPALAGAAARVKPGCEVEFSHLAGDRYAVYRPARDEISGY